MSEKSTCKERARIGVSYCGALETRAERQFVAAMNYKRLRSDSLNNTYAYSPAKVSLKKTNTLMGGTLARTQ